MKSPLPMHRRLDFQRFCPICKTAVREFVPAGWASEPHLRVSDMTREHFRRTLTVFMATGAANGGVPYSAAVNDRRSEKNCYVRNGGARDGDPALDGDSGEAERLFRKEAERHSGMNPNTIGA